MFIEQQISILEWFLKEQVTLNILKYIKIENNYFKLRFHSITVLNVFLVK